MENIDYSSAKEELLKLFEKEPLTGNRHIIFWFDEPGYFKNQITEDQNGYGEVKVLIYQNNPFTVKVKLEVEDTESNYLIYCQMKRPEDGNNWLEDMLLYSEEYYADNVALTMRRLGLSSPMLRDVVEKHLSFFASQERTDALKKKVPLNDSLSPEDMEYAMVSYLVKNPDYFNKIDFILKELILDKEDHPKYQLLKKYGLTDFLWDQIGKAYSYSGEEDIGKLADSFLLTSVSTKIGFPIETPVLKSMLMSANTEDAEIFVSSVLMPDKRYRDFEAEVYKKLKINELIASKGIDSLKSCDVFAEFDEFIIHSILISLSKGSYDYDAYLRVISDYRRSSRWYPDFETEYSFILSFIHFEKDISMPIEQGKNSEYYIEHYTKEYYRIDRDYRHVLSDYDALTDVSDEEQILVDQTDNQYETKYLAVLGPAFTKSLKDREPDYSFGKYSLSKDFYRKRLNYPAKKQFVIISDALRYEVGVDLVEALNHAEKNYGHVSLDAQITTLPSITMFGMASLLPNQEISYKDKAVLVNSKPTTTTEQRSAILSGWKDSACAIQYDEIMKMNRTQLRDFMKDKTLVYIYHDTIDNAGEHDENHVFTACKKAIEDIVALVNRLYQHLMISNYIITSDHGFIYRNKKIDDSAKYQSLSYMGLDVYSQRYAILHDDKTTLSDTVRFSMSYLGDCNDYVAVPYGYDFFRKPGGGIQYIHGGASLQELVTPVITLSQMRGSSDENVSEPVKVILKSVNRKILNKSFSLTFEQVEKVEGKKTEAAIKVYFVDEDNNVISDEKVFIANKTKEEDMDITMRFLLKNQDYDRNKRYFLVMKDANNSDDPGQSIQFTIDIVKFKMF